MCQSWRWRPTLLLRACTLACILALRGCSQHGCCCDDDGQAAVSRRWHRVLGAAFLARSAELSCRTADSMVDAAFGIKRRFSAHAVTSLSAALATDVGGCSHRTLLSATRSRHDRPDVGGLVANRPYLLHLVSVTGRARCLSEILEVTFGELKGRTLALSPSARHGFPFTPQSSGSGYSQRRCSKVSMSAEYGAPDTTTRTCTASLSTHHAVSSFEPDLCCVSIGIQSSTFDREGDAG